MAKGKLFEVAVLFHPAKTKEHIDAGTDPKSTLLKTPHTLLAQSEQEVAVRTARELPEEYLDKLEQVEIVVRPF